MVSQDSRNHCIGYQTVATAAGSLALRARRTDGILNKVTGGQSLQCIPEFPSPVTKGCLPGRCQGGAAGAQFHPNTCFPHSEPAAALKYHIRIWREFTRADDSLYILRHLLENRMRDVLNWDTFQNFQYTGVRL